MSIETGASVNRRGLKNNPGGVFAQVAEGRAVPVTNGRSVDAYVVPAAFFHDAVRAQAELEWLRISNALLASAAAGEVRLPDAAVDGIRSALGPDAVARLNAFQAAYPVHFADHELPEGAARVVDPAGVHAVADDGEDEEIRLVG